MSKFNVGDRVLIVEDSEWYQQGLGGDKGNPVGVKGTITSVDGDFHGVRWDNGTDNSYDEEDLVLVTPKSEQVVESPIPSPTTELPIDTFKSITQNNDVAIQFNAGQMSLLWQEDEYILLDEEELNKVLGAINTLEEMKNKMV